MDFIDVFGIVFGYIIFDLMLAVPIHVSVWGHDTVDNKFGWLNLWKLVWKLQLLKDINVMGKIIVEILYTIVFLPFLLIANGAWFMCFVIYYIVIKPFKYLFRKRNS